MEFKDNMDTQKLSIFAGGTKSWWVPGENPPCLCALSGTRVERRPAGQCHICMGYIRRLRAAAKEVHDLKYTNASKELELERAKAIYSRIDKLETERVLLEARIKKLNDDTREMKGGQLPMRYLDEFLEDIFAILNNHD